MNKFSGVKKFVKHQRIFMLAVQVHMWYTFCMKHRRIQTTIRDECTYDILEIIAKKKKLSLSEVVYQLVEEALEVIEDEYFGRLAQESKKRSRGKFITHEDLCKNLNIK